MPIDQTEVQRLSIKHAPVSNTEINTERLPEPKALEGMELRLRAESSAMRGLVGSPIVSLMTLSTLGALYALTLNSLPTLAGCLWSETQRTEGMTVVAGMLAGLVAVGGISILLLMPKSVRCAVLAVAAPTLASPALGYTTFGWETFSIATIMVVGTVILFRSSLLNFHRSYLSADPRMTSQQASSWKRGLRQGWRLPSPEDAAQTIQRYLSADTTHGAPGAWIAPSTRSWRITLACLLLGCTFAALGSAPALLPNPLLNALLMAVISVGLLAGFAMWLGGEAAWMSLGCEKALQPDGRTFFQQCSDRLRQSSHSAKDPISGATIREAEHLFLGFEPWQKFPVLLHEPILYEHVYISGRTGSNKTSMGLMQQMIQLIRGYRLESGAASEQRPVVVIDLKGDEALFQTAKAEAEARGQKFRFFTLEPGRASFHFNPFLGFQSSTLTVPQLVQLCLDSLDLYHGTGYGRGYYSQRSRFMLSQALRNPTGINSFNDLFARLKALFAQHPEDFRDAFELLSVVESLTFYDQLATTPAQEAGDETIRLDRFLEDREVLYFWLPTVKESATVAQIGKLLLFNLRTAAHDRQANGKTRRQAFLLIDEFQRLAGENFQQILQQARSACLATILANQSLADLKTTDWDLTPTVRTNTRTKLFFSITEPDEIQAFKELAGEEVHTFGVNESEQIRPRLSAKELASLSDHPKRLLLQVSSGSGYTQFGGVPIPVESDWPISKELSDQRAAMPWPSSPAVKKHVIPQRAIRVPQQPKAAVTAASAQAAVVPKSHAGPTLPVVPAQHPATAHVLPAASVSSVKTPATTIGGGAQPNSSPGQKPKRTKPTVVAKQPVPAKPSPAVKAVFAQKIKGLMSN